MITLVTPSISGYGVLFFGGLLEGRGAYEIVVSEETGAPRISGHFNGKIKVPKHHVTATMLLASIGTKSEPSMGLIRESDAHECAVLASRVRRRSPRGMPDVRSRAGLLRSINNTSVVGCMDAYE